MNSQVNNSLRQRDGGRRTDTRTLGRFIKVCCCFLEKSTIQPEGLLPNCVRKKGLNWRDSQKETGR